MIRLAVQLATDVEAQGHRADIAIIKTARALAAFLEKSSVGPEHIAEAARFVLLHRITNMPLASVGLLEERLEELLAGMLGGDQPDDSDRPIEEPEASWDEVDEQVPGSTAASNVDMMFFFLEEKKKLFLKQTSSSV